MVKDLAEEDILKNRNFHGNQLTMNTETKKWAFFSTLIKLKLKSDINIFLSSSRQTHQGVPIILSTSRQTHQGCPNKKGIKWRLLSFVLFENHDFLNILGFPKCGLDA